jgi:hypothetical protein
LFPNHFTHILVFPQTEKDWLAQSIIPRPLRELDLTNHRRFNPNAPLHFGGGQPWIQTSTRSRQVEKWTSFDRDLVQFNRKSFQEFFAETGADSARKFKFSVLIDEAVKARDKLVADPKVVPVG